MDPEVSFLFSDSWFDSFKLRHKISFGRSTNVSQKPADDKRSAIQGFRRNIRQVAGKGVQVGPLGQFELHQIANMELHYHSAFLIEKHVLTLVGDKMVLVRGGASGLENRQCTAQLTLFAEEQPCVKPSLIFWGKRKRN